MDKLDLTGTDWQVGAGFNLYSVEQDGIKRHGEIPKIVWVGDDDASIIPVVKSAISGLTVLSTGWTYDEGAPAGCILSSVSTDSGLRVFFSPESRVIVNGSQKPYPVWRYEVEDSFVGDNELCASLQRALLQSVRFGLKAKRIYYYTIQNL